MIGDIFTLILMDPMINLLIILNNILFNSFGLAIIAFTILMRAVTFPLTLRQLRSTRSMQALQPRVQQINKQYSDPKRRQEELMKAYREAGVNPLGCLGPMLLQFPILIALYYAVQRTLAVSPESLENLSNHLYSWTYIQHSVPLDEHFLGMDLRKSYWFMVVLVAATTYAQTKTTASVATDERARAQQQMMSFMLPLMFGFFALQFPSGVSVYWVVTSIVGVVFNVAVYGFAPLKIAPLFEVRSRAPAPEAVEGTAAAGPSHPVRETRIPANGPGRSKRQNRRRRP